MKKVLVSLTVIVSFIAYSVYQRVYGVQAITLIAPKNISSTPSGNSQNTPSSTPSPTLAPTSMPVSIQPNSSGALSSDTPTAVPQNTPTSIPTPRSGYKDGTYQGDPADAFYGNIQVQATISNGRITNIQFLQYPNDRGTSIAINSQADPMLAQEAIQAQSANVDIISGATDSSLAFVQSLQSVLDKAKS